MTDKSNSAQPPINFSIIIPTYNRAHCIMDAISSVSQQLQSGYEILIIDDGSEDETRQIVSSCKSSFLRYIRIDHAGASVARNTGLNESVGEVICFLDSDDVFYNGYFSAISSLLSEEKVSFGCTGCDWHRQWIDQFGKTIDAHQVQLPETVTVTAEGIISWNIKVPVGTGLFLKRELLSKKPTFKPDIKNLEEVDFFIQLYRISPLRFGFIPEKLFRYRQSFGGDGICSRTTYADLAHSFTRIYQQYKDDDLLKNLIAHFPQRALKYQTLHNLEQKGELYPHLYKYFPTQWSCQNLANS